jgi:hypothetical protein
MYLRRGRANTRLAQIIDSPYLPEVKVRIAITPAGITDEDGSVPTWDDDEERKNKDDDEPYPSSTREPSA